MALDLGVKLVLGDRSCTEVIVNEVVVCVSERKGHGSGWVGLRCGLTSGWGSYLDPQALHCSLEALFNPQFTCLEI